MNKLRDTSFILFLLLMFGCSLKSLTHKNDVGYHLKRGEFFLRNGQIEETISEDKKALKIDPHSTIAYNNLGEIYAFIGSYDQAIILYMKALDIEPKFVEAHFNIVVSAILSKQSDLAWRHIFILKELGEDVRILVHLLDKE